MVADLEPIRRTREHAAIAAHDGPRTTFERHHLATHPRAQELDRYFRLWLERLGIDEARHVELARLP